MNSVIILFNLWKLHVRTKRTTKTTTLIFENLSYYTLYFPEYHNILFENSYKAKSLVTALHSSLSALFTKFYKHWQKTIKHWKCFWMNFVAICNLWKLHVKLDASVCRSFSFEKRPWKTLHFLHISTSPYLESSDKAINFTRNSCFLVSLLGSIHKSFTWQSQTVHFSDGHFAVTSQTSLHMVQKTVCVFVKRKCCLNEDLYDSEQFTYNVLCTTILQRCWLHMNCILLHPIVSEKKTDSRLCPNLN